MLAVSPRLWLELTGLAAGRYQYRVSAPNHEEATGRVTILPGISIQEDLFLDFRIVSVEWSVTETTIGDSYQILLNAIFGTNIPAPVLRFEPMSLSLPDLQQGEVFHGELVLRNDGLIAIYDLVSLMPMEDDFLRFELLVEPDITLPAMSQMLPPYRIIAKRDFSVAGVTAGSGSGTGVCHSYHRYIRLPGNYLCANGVERATSATRPPLDEHDDPRSLRSRLN